MLKYLKYIKYIKKHKTQIFLQSFTVFIKISGGWCTNEQIKNDLIDFGTHFADKINSAWKYILLKNPNHRVFWSNLNPFQIWNKLFLNQNLIWFYLLQFMNCRVAKLSNCKNWTSTFNRKLVKTPLKSVLSRNT